MQIEIEVVHGDLPESVSEMHEERFAWLEGETQRVLVDCANVQADEDLFDSIANSLEFPDYFGRNWDALNECFSDYFILDDGGLGSEFGGRVGVDAQRVWITFVAASHLLDRDERLFADLVSVVSYTYTSNESRKSATLLITFQVDSSDLTNSVKRLKNVLNSRWNFCALASKWDRPV